MPPAVELVLLIAALAAAVYLGVNFGRGWLRRRRERLHLERLGAEAPPRSPAGAPRGALDRRLSGAGIRVGPAVWIAASALAAALVALGVLEAFPGNLAAAALGALVAAWLPWSLAGSWARHRARRFEEKLVDAVAYMISALEAGEILGAAVRDHRLVASASQWVSLHRRHPWCDGRGWRCPSSGQDRGRVPRE